MEYEAQLLHEGVICFLIAGLTTQGSHLQSAVPHPDYCDHALPILSPEA